MGEREVTAGEQLRTLLEQARENQAKLLRFQAVERGLMDADTLPALLASLLGKLAAAFAVERVSLVLADPDHEIRRVLDETEPPLAPEERPVLLSDPLQIAALRSLGAAPALRAWRPDADRWLTGDAPRPPGSIAVLPLHRRGTVLGALTLASADPRRYQPGVASDFLAHLAGVAGMCIENALTVERLRHAGLTDALTGVRNRRFLEARLAEEVARARRAERPLACLFVDVDHFKRVNDRLGHAVGDAVLRDVAGRISGPLRREDVLTRYGGEEFAVLLPDTSAEQARQIAERIRHTVAGLPFEVAAGATLHVTVSIGVAAAQGEALRGDDPGRALTEAADAAVLQAKREGRNRVVCAPA